MKQFLIFTVIGLCACFNINATDRLTSERLVLIEEFTNTGCAPCANFTPSLDSLLRHRMNDVVAIKYHNDYPSSRDQFYLAAKADMDSRMGYYNVTGVPTIVFNGAKGVANKNYLDSQLNMALAAEKKLDLGVDAMFQDHVLSVTANVKLLEEQDATDYRLFIVAVEEYIKLSEPVSNGERDFYYTARKIIPDAAGISLSSVVEPEHVYTFTSSARLDNFMDENQLGIVCFVQNVTTGEVVETVYVPRPTGSENAVKILSVENVSDRICSPDFAADVIFRNTGKATLKSAQLNICINDKTQTMPWSGNIDYLCADTIKISNFTDFDLSEGNNNDVRIWMSNINGSEEESVSYDLSFKNAVKAQNAVRMTFMTDKKPYETSWQLFNSAGDVVDEGGNYTDERTKYIHVFPLDVDDCYTLVFCDSGGDGIGNGYYKLDELHADGTHKMLLQATYTDEQHVVNFSLHNADITANVQNIEITEDTDVLVTDISGRRICKKKWSEVKEASALKNYGSGTYIITVPGSNNVVSKITVK